MSLPPVNITQDGPGKMAVSFATPPSSPRLSQSSTEKVLKLCFQFGKPVTGDFFLKGEVDTKKWEDTTSQSIKEQREITLTVLVPNTTEEVTFKLYDKARATTLGLGWEITRGHTIKNVSTIPSFTTISFKALPFHYDAGTRRPAV